MNDKLKIVLSKLYEDEPGIFKDCVINQFTTRELCHFNEEDFCDSKEKEFNRVNTNKKYPNFFQKIYTAGDKEQFFEYSKDFIPNDLTNKVDNTFNYMFDILKKGVFVSIVNNVLKVYLPFNNVDYKNDWGHLLNFNNKFKKLIDIGNKLIYNKGDTKYFRHVNPDTSRWYANYNMFRNEVYSNGELKGLTDEGDKSIENFLELLSEVCIRHKLPDVCFFINPRDYPVIKQSRYGFEHPYDIIFKTANKKVPSMDRYFINGYIPILSQSNSKDYADFLIPNDDDISRLLCLDPFDKFIPTIWDLKKPEAVFRGSATGSGITPESNQRLKLLEISEKHNSNKSNIIKMNVKITSPNTRLKLDPILGYCDYIKKNDDFNKKHMMSPQEQSRYKYIIHVQGHVAAFRLSKELSYGSLIIRIKNPWKVWFDDFIKPFNPLRDKTDKKDKYKKCHIVECELDDISQTLDWCHQHDDICKQISENGYKFYMKYLSNKEFMIAYTAHTLIKISEINEFGFRPSSPEYPPDY